MSSSRIPGDETLIAEDPLLVLLDSSKTGIGFQNIISETFEMNITTHINTSNGGGVAILDANKDGLQDIYMISSSGQNRFYVNRGNLTFEDHTMPSGLGSPEGFEVAVTVADVNQDGWQDIYVCRAGPVENEDRRNKLFINNKDLTFTEQSKEYGLDDKSASMGACFIDYDMDGDLDLYLLNYPVDFGYSSRIHVKPNADGTGVEPLLDPIQEYDSDRFYRNDGVPDGKGNGGFKDISKEAGIWNFGYGLAVTTEDFNQDGWPDIYVANDFIQPDLLYINNRNGTFTDRLADYFRHTTQHTMGIDPADFDNDGMFDLFAVDMLSKTQYRKKTLLSTNSQNKYTTLIRNGYFEPVVRNVLQRNNGNGTFSDVGCMANVYDTDWSWSGLFADLDNDGWKDLLVTNGYQREVTDVDFINFEFAEIKAKGAIRDQFQDVHDFLNMIPQYKLRDYVFRNKGDWTFEDVSGQWLTTPATWSNGAAYSDLDNDGDLDYIVNNINDPAFIYENKSNEKLQNRYLQIQLKGPSENEFAYGTKIRIWTGDQMQYAMLSPTRGIFSSVEPIIHFGLGNADRVDRIEITWPDQKTEVLEKILGNQRLQIDYGSTPAGSSHTTFRTADKSTAWLPAVIPFRHQENEYIDFEYTFLMPWSLSDLGPSMDTSDVNKDGLTDVYIGNAFGKSGALFLQRPGGSFEILSPDTWAADSLYEDHGALFFDADMDGDQDLFVISGGYESVSPEAWQSRLYINDNGRQFVHARGAIPLLPHVGSKAAAFDYDKDGDTDLFIGSRVVPGKYPSTPDSYILRNDRNKFTEVAGEIAPEFQKAGMVTDLKFANIDGDPAFELIVVGEWMNISIFNFENGKWIRDNTEESGLENSQGFWNSLEIADLDQDGDMDIITGNLGLNTHYRATADKPIQCYVDDFDQNGSLDPIITIYEGNKSYPIVQKDVLIKQIPAMKKKFIFAKDYGTATIEDVLTSKQRSNAIVLSSRIMTSGWWQNNNGKFEFHSFPSQAQVSPVQAILVDDFTGDGKPDIFVAGNKFRMEVETGRLDAGIGCLLRNTGNGFTWIPNTQSGLWASKDARDVAYLRGLNGRDMIIVSNNNQTAEAFIKNNSNVLVSR